MFRIPLPGLSLSFIIFIETLPQNNTQNISLVSTGNVLWWISIVSHNQCDGDMVPLIRGETQRTKTPQIENSSHSVKVRRKVICLHTSTVPCCDIDANIPIESSLSLLSTSLAEALISNVASLMSSPARLYRISLLITVLTLDTTLSWRKLFQSSILRSQLLFTSCYHKSVTGVVVL